MDLKDQGYTDEYVAEKMKSEGRTRYVPRSVGSRYLRLRQAIDKSHDAVLDDELSDWHIEEDEKLQTAFDIVERLHKEELIKLEGKKWQAVSTHIAKRMDKKKYSAQACRERYTGLNDGTALLPIELDTEQEGRKALRETRIEPPEGVESRPTLRLRPPGERRVPD